jgi:HSP20 family protein
MAETRSEERRETGAGARQQSGSSNGRNQQPSERGPQGQSVQTQPGRARSGRDVSAAGGSGRDIARRRGGREIWEPLAMMGQLSREMDRVWESFFGRSPFRERGEEDWQMASVWSPRVDMERRDDRLLLRADLPGVRKDDVEIDVSDDVLSISGERRFEREAGDEDDDGYRVVERSYGRFYRSVPLPAGVNADDVSATMRDGVLEISVTLPQSARRRRITIQG